MEVNRRKFTVGLVAAFGAFYSFSNFTKSQEGPLDKGLVDNSDMAQSTLITPQVKDLYGALLQPFVRSAAIRRQSKKEYDSLYESRIDWDFTKDRLNFLLFGYGETHEPPLTERAEIGSISVLSLNLETRMIDIVSLTHDIRAPEIERYQKIRGNENTFPTKIYRAYEFGGFPLMAEVLENATGLAIDFQVAFHDRFIKKAVDHVFEGAQVETEEEFSVYPFYLDGIKYPERTFKKGRQALDGLGVLGFIKTVPIPKSWPPIPLKIEEHNFRKHLVIKGLAEKFRSNIRNPIFLWKLSNLLESDRTTLAYDFNPQELLFSNLTSVASEAGKKIFGADSGTPFSIGETVYIVDSAHGDGGVQWVNASRSPVILDEIKKGRFPDLAMEVPINADSRAEDLAAGYWPSVRRLVRERFYH